MKNPNYKDTQGKHPIPHAKGIAKDETRKNDSNPKGSSKSDKSKEEE
ncbi:hypothetical protein SAMN03097699_2353 [Flavobacteriaceae bacterium MAR_2010_188]|nr:hypothetical protein SAMN03097699_2353 [Flavobacteriaceae bacterium MAR_2010_188]